MTKVTLLREVNSESVTFGGFPVLTTHTGNGSSLGAVRPGRKTGARQSLIPARPFHLRRARKARARGEAQNFDATTPPGAEAPRNSNVARIWVQAQRPSPQDIWQESTSRGADGNVKQ